MLKTIFNEGSSLNIRAMTCGFINSHHKTNINTMKSYAARKNLNCLYAQQLIDNEEMRISILNKKLKRYSLFTEEIDRFDYILVVNPVIVSSANPVNIIEESASFPFLNLKQKRDKHIELSYLSSFKKIELKKFNPPYSFFIQAIIDEQKGLHFLHPWRNKGELSILPGFESLFSKDFDINKYNTMYKEEAFDCDTKEFELIVANTLLCDYNKKIETYAPYLELKQVLLEEYQDIQEMGFEEFSDKVSDTINEFDKKQYYKLIQSLDLNTN